MTLEKKDIKKEMGNVVTERTLNPSPIYDFTNSVRIFLSITAKCSALYHDVLKV